MTGTELSRKMRTIENPRLCAVHSCCNFLGSYRDLKRQGDCEWTIVSYVNN